MRRRGGNHLSAFLWTAELGAAISTLGWRHRVLKPWRTLTSRQPPTILLLANMNDKKRTVMGLLVHETVEIDRPTFLQWVRRYRDLYIRHAVEDRYKRRLKGSGILDPIDRIRRGLALCEREITLHEAGLVNEEVEYDLRATIRKMFDWVIEIEAELEREKRLCALAKEHAKLWSDHLRMVLDALPSGEAS